LSPHPDWLLFCPQQLEGLLDCREARRFSKTSAEDNFSEAPTIILDFPAAYFLRFSAWKFLLR
jgi:hypothetical protein